MLRFALPLLFLTYSTCDPQSWHRPKPSESSHKETRSPRALKTLKGRVVGVADGDTVTVLDSESQQHKIRLVGIDAPEKAMPYGQRSKQALSDLVYGNEVEVEIRNRDRYGREVGRILIHGKDANLAQIEAGMAWVYRQYLKELSPREANTYITAENTVRAIGRGLWGAPNPTPPWEWRKSKH